MTFKFFTLKRNISVLCTFKSPLKLAYLFLGNALFISLSDDLGFLLVLL